MNNANKKYKITFLCGELYNYFYPKSASSFGGISRVYSLVKYLDTLPKYRPICYVNDYGQGNRLTLKSIQLIRSNVGNRYRVHEIFFKLLKSRPDLIIEFYATPMLFVLRMLKILVGQKYLLFIGNDPDVDGGYAQRTNFFFFHLYNWGLKGADKIICQTPRQANLLQKNYGLKSHVITSPYIKMRRPHQADRAYFLWVGRSASQKRPDLFVRLARKLPELTFLMICNPSEHDNGQHPYLMEESRQIGNLVFLERVLPEQMHMYYSQAICLVNTSEFEGFPNTFIEAAVEKTPIISLNVDPNSILSKKQAGLCCGGDFHRLIALCKDLAVNQEKAITLGEKARRYAERYHDHDQAMLQIKRVIDDVIGK